MPKSQLSDIVIINAKTTSMLKILLEQNREEPRNFFKVPIESSIFFDAFANAYLELTSYFLVEQDSNFQKVVDSLSILFQILEFKDKSEQKSLLSLIEKNCTFDDSSKQAMLNDIASNFIHEGDSFHIKLNSCLEHEGYVFDTEEKNKYVNASFKIDGTDILISETIIIPELAEVQADEADTRPEEFEESDDEVLDTDSSGTEGLDGADSDTSTDPGYGTMKKRAPQSKAIEITNPLPSPKTLIEPGSEVFGSSPPRCGAKNSFLKMLELNEPLQKPYKKLDAPHTTLSGETKGYASDDDCIFDMEL